MITTNIRTDLAIEHRELVKGRAPDGVSVFESTCGQITVTRITVENEKGAAAVGKPQGNYITCDLPDPMINEYTDTEIKAISKCISDLVGDGSPILVVGLGNHSITPDSLGPLVIDQIISTRHLNDDVGPLRSVCALAPGVMGQTGIETVEIIKGVCDRISPACVIAVDALASKSIQRLGTTLQISDVGISPGSGVLNRRKEISKAVIGVKVVSVGVPTVVDGVTLLCDMLGTEEPEGIDTEAARRVMVTPREIDSIIKRAVKITALAINSALQPTLTVDEINSLIS